MRYRFFRWCPFLVPLSHFMLVQNLWTINEESSNMLINCKKDLDLVLYHFDEEEADDKFEQEDVKKRLLECEKSRQIFQSECRILEVDIQNLKGIECLSESTPQFTFQLTTIFRTGKICPGKFGFVVYL